MNNYALEYEELVATIGDSEDASIKKGLEGTKDKINSLPHYICLMLIS